MPSATFFSATGVVAPTPPSVTVLFVASSYVTAASDLPVDGSIRPASFSCDTFTASMSATPAFTFDSVVPLVPASVALSWLIVPSAFLSYVTAADVSLPAPSSPTRPASFIWPRFSASWSSFASATFFSCVGPVPLPSVTEP